MLSLKEKKDDKQDPGLYQLTEFWAPRPSTSWPLMAQSNAEGRGRDPDLQVWLEHAPCVLGKEKGRRETSLPRSSFRMGSTLCRGSVSFRPSWAVFHCLRLQLKGQRGGARGPPGTRDRGSKTEMRDGRWSSACLGVSASSSLENRLRREVGLLG